MQFLNSYYFEFLHYGGYIILHWLFVIYFLILFSKYGSSFSYCLHNFVHPYAIYVAVTFVNGIEGYHAAVTAPARMQVAARVDIRKLLMGDGGDSRYKV